MTYHDFGQKQVKLGHFFLRMMKMSRAGRVDSSVRGGCSRASGDEKVWGFVGNLVLFGEFLVGFRLFLGCFW